MRKVAEKTDYKKKLWKLAGMDSILFFNTTEQ